MYDNYYERKMAEDKKAADELAKKLITNTTALGVKDLNSTIKAAQAAPVQGMFNTMTNFKQGANQGGGQYFGGAPSMTMKPSTGPIAP